MFKKTHMSVPTPLINGQLPPLGKWSKKSYAATEATLAGIGQRWYGNVEIDHIEPGFKSCSASIYKVIRSGDPMPAGFKLDWAYKKPAAPGTPVRIVHQVKPTYKEWDSEFLKNFKNAGAARKALNAYLASNPSAYESWKSGWPYPSIRKVKTQAKHASYKTPKGYSEGQLGYGLNDVVQVKVQGGDKSSPLYVGLDSKGRTKFELTAPKGTHARKVARELKKAAQAGQTVLGGIIYAIDIHRPKHKTVRYYVSK